MCTKHERVRYVILYLSPPPNGTEYHHSSHDNENFSTTAFTFVRFNGRRPENFPGSLWATPAKGWFVTGSTKIFGKIRQLSFLLTYFRYFASNTGPSWCCAILGAVASSLSPAHPPQTADTERGTPPLYTVYIHTIYIHTIYTCVSYIRFSLFCCLSTSLPPRRPLRPTAGPAPPSLSPPPSPPARPRSAPRPPPPCTARTDPRRGTPGAASPRGRLRPSGALPANRASRPPARPAVVRSVWRSPRAAVPGALPYPGSARSPAGGAQPGGPDYAVLPAL